MMLYEIAHIIKEKFGFLWDVVEWGNEMLFTLMHNKGLKEIPGILREVSNDTFTIRLTKNDDVPKLVKFFREQPEDAYKFFKPHGFDEKSVGKVLRNKAFMTFVVVEDDTILGYFFMRSFVNGKTFKGYIVGSDYRGKGVAKKMGIAMNRVASKLGLRMFKSISPNNPASLAVTEKVNDISIIKTLDNGDMLMECFVKADA